MRSLLNQTGHGTPRLSHRAPATKTVRQAPRFQAPRIQAGHAHASGSAAAHRRDRRARCCWPNATLAPPSRTRLAADQRGRRRAAPGGGTAPDRHHRKQDARVERQRPLRHAAGAQPLGASALEEAQIVRIVNDAAGVGVLPVDARVPHEDAQIPSPNSDRLDAARSGILRPKCCHASRVATRPRAVRATSPAGSETAR